MRDLKFVQNIASGMVGIVDEYVDDTGKKFAKKTFSPKNTFDPNKLTTLRKRFIREVKIQSQLSPQLFIPILHHHLEGDNPWYIMPLAETVLTELIEVTSQQIPPKDVLFDIMNSMDHLHELNYVHRDIKPQNILKHDGQWKLSDLGFIRVNDATELLTTHAGAWGTDAYCSPEQVQLFSSVTPVADIYSFGCVIHDFASSDRRIPYRKHTCYGEFVQIVEKCTETNPSRRFQSVRELREAIGYVFSIIESDVQGDESEENSDDQSSWIHQVKHISAWDTDRFAAFVTHLERESGCDSYDCTLLSSVSEADFEVLRKLDNNYWVLLVDYYCNWVKNSSFEFNFCDILIGRLLVVYRLGSTSEKAKAVVAAAALGAGHNRWNVMNQVIKMSDKSLPNDIAKRIAIEIKVENLENEFIKCATQVNKSVSYYHPLIEESIIGK